MKIYKIARYDEVAFPREQDAYLNIGHKPTGHNPIWLWSIDNNGVLKKWWVTDAYTEHGEGLGNMSVHKAIAQGRYEPVSGRCSVAYLGFSDGQKVSKEWIKQILRGSFKNVRDFFEFETYNAKANKTIGLFRIF